METQESKRKQAPMMSHETPQLWKHIAKESIWGNRGLIKISSLFLPLSVILTFNIQKIGQKNQTTFFHISLVVTCWLLLSIIFNDIADSISDSISGRMRWVNRLSPVYSVLILFLLFGIGLGTLLLSQSPISTKWVFVAAVVFGLFYSFKPLRLKEHGILGLFTYSAACALGYCLVPWTWLYANWTLLLLLAPAIFLDKWVNLHFHQIVDYESDLKMGTKTYAVLAGPENARKTLKWISWLASLWLVVVVLFVALLLPEWRVIIIPAVSTTALACIFYIFITRRSFVKETSLVRELPGLYLGLTYAVLRLLPLVLLIRLSLWEPSMWAAFALTVIILAVESWFFLRYHYE
jgi:4-hydroxybenzoate polyprenyltransferase